MTAQAIAALAESCRPYGYESFRPLLEDLLEGIKTMSGKLTKTQQEMVWRNKPLTDADLDRLLPPGYEIVPPPASYVFFSFGRSTSRNLKTTTQPISLPLLLLPICLVLS